jgi:single-strand DNA-binding protein
MSFQTTIIEGNLTKDPEKRFTPAGQAVTNFSVAVNHEYTGDNGKVKEVSYFRVNVWGKQAENCYTYLKKGQGVIVEGRLLPDPETGSPRIYKKSDGSYGSSYEISASTVRFLSGKGEDADNEFPF